MLPQLELADPFIKMNSKRSHVSRRSHMNGFTNLSMRQTSYSARMLNTNSSCKTSAIVLLNTYNQTTWLAAGCIEQAV